MANEIKDVEKALNTLKELLHSPVLSTRAANHLKAALESLEEDLKRANGKNR
jgi:hypothetical protein